jgi:hypothetical protein
LKTGSKHCHREYAGQSRVRDDDGGTYPNLDENGLANDAVEAVRIFATALRFETRS